MSADWKVADEWTDPATGYACLAIETDMGSLCGYVALPADHPWIDKHYGSELCGHWGCYEHTPASVVHVHGGLAFTGTRKMSQHPLAVWFGFDCSHSGDLVPGLSKYAVRNGDVYRDLDFVRTECTSLARQLAAVKP